MFQIICFEITHLNYKKSKQRFESHFRYRGRKRLKRKIKFTMEYYSFIFNAENCLFRENYIFTIQTATL